MNAEGGLSRVGEILAFDALQSQSTAWLLANGASELESLVRGILLQTADRLPIPNEQASENDSAHARVLLDLEGRILSWDSGSALLYGYSEQEAVGAEASFLYADEENSAAVLDVELSRAAAEGHFGFEDWHARKDGSRFRGNAITMALRNDHGELQGYARVIRDFTDQHASAERSRRGREPHRTIPMESTIAGVVSGEFEVVGEANDAFLDLLGYTRDDLVCGRFRWAELSPPEYATLDDSAHEECLQFGACTPYEKDDPKRWHSCTGTDCHGCFEAFAISMDYIRPGFTGA